MVIDNHYYFVWKPAETHDTVESVCKTIKDDMKKLSEHKYEVWVGEWSMATDPCAMWLEAFNDSNLPRIDQCQWVDCPKPYLPAPFGVDLDRTADIQGPFGNDRHDDIPKFGKCPIDSDRFNNEDLYEIGQCMLEAYNENLGAQIMWTYHNELEPRWSYKQAYDAGWLKPQPTSEKPKLSQN